jgi:TrmH family RNA methyltransferase
MYPSIESLNVGVAAGISIYELRLKIVLTMIEQKIKSTLGRELGVAVNLVQQVLEAALCQVSGFTSRHVIFLMVLICEKSMTLDHICEQFGILEKNSKAFLEPLHESKLVELNDGQLTMTLQGEEVLSKLWMIVETTEKKILGGLNEGEVRTLKEALKRI